MCPDNAGKVQTHRYTDECPYRKHTTPEWLIYNPLLAQESPPQALRLLENHHHGLLMNHRSRPLKPSCHWLLHPFVPDSLAHELVTVMQLILSTKEQKTFSYNYYLQMVLSFILKHRISYDTHFMNRTEDKVGMSRMWSPEANPVFNRMIALKGSKVISVITERVEVNRKIFLQRLACGKRNYFRNVIDWHPLGYGITFNESCLRKCASPFKFLRCIVSILGQTFHAATKERQHNSLTVLCFCPRKKREQRCNNNYSFHSFSVFLIRHFFPFYYKESEVPFLAHTFNTFYNFLTLLWRR